MPAGRGIQRSWGSSLCSTRTLAPSGTSSISSGTRCSGCTASPTWSAQSPSTSAGPGLDHIAFGFASRDELAEWAVRLDDLGVARSDIVDASYGSGLSFRDPDNIALELFAAAG